MFFAEKVRTQLDAKADLIQERTSMYGGLFLKLEPQGKGKTLISLMADDVNYVFSIPVFIGMEETDSFSGYMEVMDMIFKEYGINIYLDQREWLNIQFAHHVA